MHTYLKSKTQPYLYTVGYWRNKTFVGGIVEETWEPMEDCSSETEARRLTNYLNGGEGTTYQPIRQARPDQGQLIQRIKDALGTDEDGEDLIAVARDAHEAERELASLMEGQR